MGNGVNFGFGSLGSYVNELGIDWKNFAETRAKIEKGYGSTEPLATKVAAQQQSMITVATIDFMQHDKDGSGYFDEVEFYDTDKYQKTFSQNEQESRNLFNAIAEKGKISPERYGAFMNVRDTGDGLPQNGIVSFGVNDRLREVAQKGPNTLGFSHKAMGKDFDKLTLGQAIDLVQYGKIKYATTEQIDKGYLKLQKEN